MHIGIYYENINFTNLLKSKNVYIFEDMKFLHLRFSFSDLISVYGLKENPYFPLLMTICIIKAAGRKNNFVA